jgi:acyl carrier protein
LHLQRDNPYEAVKLANEGLMLAKKSGDRRMQVTLWTLVATAQIALLTQDGQANLGKQANKALRPAQEALSMAKKLADRELIGSALHTLANVQLRSGKAAEAMANLNEARSIFYKSGNKSWEISVVLLMAETQIAKGMEDKAKELANTALDMARACGESDREKEANALIEKLTPKPTMPPAGQWVMQMPVGAVADSSAPGQANATTAPASTVAEAPKEKGLNPAVVSAAVLDVAKQITGGDDELHGDTALMDAGLDSLSALSFRQTLSQNMGVKLPSSFVFDYPTINEVTNRIVEISKED